ncbi:hypothetical protein, partial [Streptomyces sp. ID01-9D]|uniref:hypothetical protein n=1 Tax=Streptomyces sp. ID01-9D TaxID=3028659 RepID=UPI0029C4CF66
IGKIINNMLEIFKEISNNSTQVSKHCDIGIMSVVDRPQEWIVYKHKMSGNATELINSYNEGTFENKIDVVGATNIPKNIRV